MSQTGATPQIWDARKNVKRDALNRSSVKSSEPRFLATHLLHRFNASRFFAGHVARHGLGTRADAHFFEICLRWLLTVSMLMKYRPCSSNFGFRAETASLPTNAAAGRSRRLPVLTGSKLVSQHLKRLIFSGADRQTIRPSPCRTWPRWRVRGWARWPG